VPQRVDINLNFLTIAIRSEIARRGVEHRERIFISKVIFFPRGIFERIFN
jgi:hypothetical protein